MQGFFPNLSCACGGDCPQVTKKGKQVDITNMPIHVTLGVTSSDPCLPLPNVLLMARGKMLGKDHPAAADLSFVDLSR